MEESYQILVIHPNVKSGREEPETQESDWGKDCETPPSTLYDSTTTHCKPHYKSHTPEPLFFFN